MKRIVSFLNILLLCSAAYAQADNTELQQMADADQAARSVPDVDWKVLNVEDSLRRVRVFELIDAGKVVTAQDHLNAGIVFQHGHDTVASAMAVKSFKRALELDSTLNRWWYPAAVDRDLMRRQLPQVYGTQFIKNPSTGDKWRRYTIDPSRITDEERRYYGVETLAEQEEKERLMNQLKIPDYYAETRSIDKTIEEIRRQFRQGSLSAYNVSEDAINSFGYALLAQNLEHEALEIFKLNTELYPKAFNTHDSYGEILLKTGRTKAAKKAYKRSLRLNPQNDNARVALKRIKML